MQWHVKGMVSALTGGEDFTGLWLSFGSIFAYRAAQFGLHDKIMALNPLKSSSGDMALHCP